MKMMNGIGNECEFQTVYDDAYFEWIDFVLLLGNAILDNAFNEKFIRPFPIDPFESRSQHPVWFLSKSINMRENHCSPPFHPHAVDIVFHLHETFTLWSKHLIFMWKETNNSNSNKRNKMELLKLVQNKQATKPTTNQNANECMCLCVYVSKAQW